MPVLAPLHYRLLRRKFALSFYENNVSPRTKHSRDAPPDRYIGTLDRSDMASRGIYSVVNFNQEIYSVCSH
jgi:hypothetical protein